MDGAIDQIGYDHCNGRTCWVKSRFFPDGRVLVLDHGSYMDPPRVDTSDDTRLECWADADTEMEG